ncbi:MAG: hypothetical protein KDD52_07800, partial [Bdellovibrionales bacterium]|nr:hypothetical protein [Bdellovibrionales bacterium]
MLVLFFVSYAFSQTSEKPWTVEEYFQFIVENPSSSSDILSKNIENIDPNLRSLEEGIRELSPQKVVASLSGKNISLEQSIFFETIRDPFHVVRMHKYNQQSQAFKDRVLSYGLGQYASYMTTPLVLLSSFSFQNKEMV